MIDYKEELKKFKPALEVEELEKDINLNDLHDVMKLLQYVVNRNDKTDKE